jgi:hypothetical protein
MEQVWTALLPQNGSLPAREPVGLVGSLCNGAFQVSQQRGARLEPWLARMREALPHCDSLNRVLEVGHIAAWQAGMPQYRRAALEAATQLPTNLASQVLGLPTSTSAESLAAALKRLQANPWLKVPEALHDQPVTPQLKAVGMAGAFTGFGGEFARPPVISNTNGGLIAKDGNSCWQFIADAYGTWFRRLPDRQWAAENLPGGVAVDRSGKLKWNHLSLSVPHLANASGSACDGVTLAVTIGTSHHVFLFAKSGGSL